MNLAMNHAMRHAMRHAIRHAMPSAMTPAFCLSSAANAANPARRCNGRPGIRCVQRPPSARGFTLIEAVVSLLLLAIVASTLIGLNGHLFQGREHLHQLALNTPLLQACAERVLAMRRAEGFSADPAFDAACDAITGDDRFDVNVTPNSASASCPAGAQCQRVDIYVKSPHVRTGPVVLQWVDH